MTKLVFFLKASSSVQQLSRLRISYLIWCDLFPFYGRRKEDLSYLEGRRFLPIMLGECGSYSGKDDLFFLLRICLPDRAAARNAFLFYRRRGDRLMGYLTYIMKSRLTASFGGVTDRERKHLGKKASGI